MSTRQATMPRVAVITGAAGNLGRAIAETFAAAGYSLALLDVDVMKLEEAYGDDSRSHAAWAADLTDRGQVQAVIDACLERYGQIDVLCNAAGGFSCGPLVHETDRAEWEHLFSLNVRTMMEASHAVVPLMLERKRGSIVNVGASSALRGIAGMGPYTAAKSAVIRLTEAMSAELRDSNINVNCVLPSILDTPGNRKAMPGADPARWVHPQALAAVMLFLASDAASPIHGVSLPVTGTV
ncbi:2-(R)-hydroxypropyl-CoM dehydrogenase [compost metagenome]